MVYMLKIYVCYISVNNTGIFKFYNKKLKFLVNKNYKKTFKLIRKQIWYLEIINNNYIAWFWIIYIKTTMMNYSK